MNEDLGVSPSGPGHSAEPEPVPVSAVPASVPDALGALDEWCKTRIARLTEKAGEHVMAGRSLEAPRYRTMLGEHRAYMAMRSFIHGCRAFEGRD